MSVLMIVEVEITNNEMYSEYVEKVPEIISRYGGRYLVRGGKVTSLTGNWNPERIILIEFETIEHLQRCFESAEYLEIARLREQSTNSKAIILEGYLPPD
ncbi:MAG: DUF1330 domain-containing protein [Deltaproteobacteria bacterium]|nr:DUF1330 domain-containing protein [Deltaproteobacteria bacterium]